MKRCPQCNRTYWDEISFCLEDGAVLSAPYDPQRTLVLPTPNNPDLPPTELSAPTMKFDGVRADKEIVAAKSAGKRRRWNEISFFEEAVKNLKIDEVEKLRRLYEFSIECADRVKWGTGSQRGSFNAMFDSLSPSKSLYTVYSDGNLDLNFGWLPDGRLLDIKKSAELIDEFARSLKRLKGFDISSDFRDRFIRVRKEHWMPQISQLMQAIRTISDYQVESGFDDVD